MPTEAANKEQFDKAVGAAQTIELIVANNQRSIDVLRNTLDTLHEQLCKCADALDTLSGLTGSISLLSAQVKALGESSTDMEEVTHVTEEANKAESTVITEINMSKSITKKNQTIKPEIADTRVFEPVKKVVKENALKEKILDTVCVFGRKYKGLKFREILNRQGGEDFVRRLAKSQSMLAPDCAYLVTCIEKEKSK